MFVKAKNYALAYEKDFELKNLFSLEYIKKHASNLCFKGGRGQTALFSLDNQDLVLRRYLRGGLWGKLMGDKFYRFAGDAHRAVDELKLLDKLLALNLPVPEPVIAREEAKGLFLYNSIIIKQIKDSRDLSFIINHRALSQEEFLSIGETLNRFFAAGLLHTDLNIRNILIDKNGKVYLIDFDKCKLTSLSAADKEAMLSRLLRSFNKEVATASYKVFFKAEDFAILKQAALAR